MQKKYVKNWPDHRHTKIF